jgi:bacterioferritin-associated ferredoxin
MNIQQVIALGIVAIAALYLGRNAVRAFQALRSGKSCGSGCGKCGVAAQIEAARKSTTTVRPSSARPSQIITLSEISSPPSKHTH